MSRMEGSHAEGGRKVQSAKQELKLRKFTSSLSSVMAVARLVMRGWILA